MHSLEMGTSPSDSIVSTADDVRWRELRDCKHSLSETACHKFKARDQTWQEMKKIGGTGVRFMVVGDVGRRGVPDKTTAHADALRVRDAGAKVCGETCAAAIFLGDNVYNTGINEYEDTLFLQRLTEEYLSAHKGFVPELYMSQGNHDWGPGVPQRDRAQRLHQDISQRLGDHVHGAAHFWHAQFGPLRVASLDSNYLVRRCKETNTGTSKQPSAWSDRGVACPDEKSPTLYEGLFNVVGRAGANNTVVVAHHPWYGNGRHGTAAYYRDPYMGLDNYTVGRGGPWRVALENVVRPRAALFLSGHDHNVQVHHSKKHPGTLSVIVGSGSKVSPPGRNTAVGKKYHQQDMVLEAHCRLGFAVVEHQQGKLSVQIYSLNGSNTPSCNQKITKTRGAYEPHLGKAPTSASPALHDLRCRRFEFTEKKWTSTDSCEDFSRTLSADPRKNTSNPAQDAPPESQGKPPVTPQADASVSKGPSLHGM